MTEKYGSWTVLELKKELRRRNARLTGKKEDLIERLAAYDRNNNFDHLISLDLSVDVDHTLLSSIVWPPYEIFTSISVSSVVPPIDIVHINNFFLSVYNLEEGMSTCAATHRKGYNMMLNFFTVAMIEAKQQEHCFYRAQVNSEMTKSLSYYVKLVLLNDGSIVEASCECIAGKGCNAVCKHVAVVCYLLLNMKEHKKLYIKQTCTDQKQVWNMPKKTKLSISPKKAEEINFNVPVYNKSKKLRGSLCFDPRPLQFRNMPNFNDNVRNNVLNYTASRKRTFCINGAFEVASLRALANDHDYFSISIMHQMVYNQIKVTKEDIKSIEERTRSQSNCVTWYQQRCERLTASNVGTIVHMTDKRNVKKLVKDLTEPKSFSSPATDWGKKNERRAILQYQQLSAEHVTNCGLFISLDHPYLAASPDGLVQSNIVLEIKCPYTARGSLINTESVSYLEIIDNELCLKRSSNYYFQVQTQMLVTGFEYCHFVVWTPKDYCCIKIKKDHNIINNIIIPKCKDFYDKYMVPAIFEKYS